MPGADYVVLPDHLVQQKRDERKSVIISSLGEGGVYFRSRFTEARNVVSFRCFVGEFDGMRQGIEVIHAVTTSEPCCEGRFDQLASLVEVSNGGVLKLQVKGESLGESINWGRRDLRSSVSAAANCQQAL